MEERQRDIVRVRDFEQLDLRALQRPARSEDAAILRAVGVAEHDRLATAARIEVCAIDRVAEQRRERAGCRAQVVDRLEQWRDVERHRAIRIDEAAGARECEHCEHVGNAAGHADHVDTECGVAMAQPCIRERGENGCRPRQRRICAWPRQRADASRVGRDRRDARVVRLRQRAERFGQRGRVHARILARVEAREMEAERRDAPLQAAHGEPARMRAGVRAQA